MGSRHSKRSLDIVGTPSKGEIEGVGNAGKLEKIVDGIVEKVSANGHVEGELQNGAEPLQNGLEPVQNGEAAAAVAVSLDNAVEKLKNDKEGGDDKEAVAVVANGDADEKSNGELNEKIGGDAEGKKDKKKDRKEKVVKKKFSFRSFSFSKKDKSKPPKEEKAPAAAAPPKGKVEIEESAEVVEEAAEVKVGDQPQVEVAIAEAVKEKEEPVVEPVEPALEDKKKDIPIVAPSPIVVLTVDTSAVEAKPEVLVEKAADDLPPPLPASPPPTEAKGEVTTPAEEVKCAENEVLTTVTEQIEEKATDLLKVVEEKVVESKRNESEGLVAEDVEAVAVDVAEADASVVMVEEPSDAKTVEVEDVVPTNIPSLGTLTGLTAEDASEKQEEFGAGESLAEMDAGTETTTNATEAVAVAE